MNFINKTLLALAVGVAVCSIPANAQDPMTPYSMYGYGIIRDNVTSSQRAMGGVGYAMRNGRQINVMNPASYAAVDSITFLFDMGISVTRTWSKEGDKSGKNFGGGLDYLTMLFPVSKRVGVSVGLLPYSSVGYSFGSKIDNGADTRTGSGGLNWLYAGVGYRPVGGLTVGANMGYLFGTTVNAAYGITEAGSTSLFEKVVQVRDYHLQIGAQYFHNINMDNRVGVGVTFSPGKDLHGHAWGVNYDRSTDTKPDTIGYTSLKNKYSIPVTWGAGASYEWRDRLMVELDFTYQPWKDAKYTYIDREDELMAFDDRWKVALGAQFIPRPRGNYGQRIAYRMGGFYEHSYLNVRGNNVREYGASIGFGLPAPGSKTLINLGVEWRHRQASPVSMIKENYINFTIGINFNERWFYQNKIR